MLPASHIKQLQQHAFSWSFQGKELGQPPPPLPEPSTNKELADEGQKKDSATS